MAAGAAGIVLAAPALAQSTGGISGTIVDATNQNPIKDAVVIAQSPSLQGEQTAVTDDKGVFEISLLPAGVYTLNVQREGFQPFSQQGLKVNLDKTIKVKLQIVPDSFKGEQVEIVAVRPTIAVTSTTAGGTVSKEQMNLIPYGRGARGFEAVATSIPGVQGDQYGFAVNGSGSPESNYIIDGVNVTNPAFGTQGTTLIQDFVQEVDIKTGGYQAEYGRATGGIINVVTKSGGNEFHGSVFVNWSPFEAERKQVGSIVTSIASKVKQNYNLDFGAELGGPIIKDKLWFFAGFAPQILSLDVDRIISARQDNGNGQAKTDASGNLLLSEIARKTYTNTQTSYQFTGKLTYLLNENHSIAVAIYGNPNTTTGLTGGVNSNGGASFADIKGGSTDVSLRYSGKLFNKSMLIEATAAYHREINKTETVGVGTATAAQLRDTPVIQWRQPHNLLDPVFTADPTTPDYQKDAKVLAACAIQANGFDPCPVTNYATGGFGFLGDQTLNRISGVLKLSNFVELAGHHQFKYGIDASQDKYSQNKTYSGGAFIRALPTTGVANTPVTQFQYFRAYGKEDPANPGRPLFAANSGTDGITRYAGDVVSNETKNVSIAAFAQDTWSILDKVVLDLGIRFEKQMMYADPNTTDENGNKVSGAQIDLTNIMPRIGLIYDFTQRGLSKVYASFGRFYEYIPLDLADRALSAEVQVNVRTNPASCRNPNDPRTCDPLVGAVGGRTYAFTGGAAGTSVDPNMKGQYADEYQAGVQYQIYRDISVGVDFVHKQIGRVIEDMSVNDGATYFLSNPGEPGTLGYQAVTGNGTIVNEPKPRRIYDGVTLSVAKNFSENWLATASYTYSSFRGNYPGLFRSENGQLDPNILSEYDLVSLLPNKEGPLPGDVPNAFKIDGAYVYEVSPTLNINLGGNIRAQQGAPMNYLGAHPLYGASEAFILPRGSAGRLPWTWTLNLRAQAQYKLTKDYNLGVTVDLFNVTNNRETTAVDQNYTFQSVSPIVNGKVSDLQYLRTTDGQLVSKNANFLQPTAYQLPFSARVGAKLSF